MGPTSYHVSCCFCGDLHSSDYWDEIAQRIERCRERASPEARAELAAWVPDRGGGTEGHSPRDCLMERAA